jgi:two-component system response regulator DctR
MGKKILVIDDEIDIVYTIKEICEFSGFEVFTASNGKDGLEICKKEEPNLIVLDYHMPGWDGLKTVEKIKEVDETVSILVLTVDERQEIANKFIETGATDFAIKPIKAPDLIARINVNLRISEIQQQAKVAKENVYVAKGISAATLLLIEKYMRGREEGETIDQVSKGVDLAYQTVHRYIHYMLQIGKVEVSPVYGQVGRPKNHYKIVG